MAAVMARSLRNVAALFSFAICLLAVGHMAAAAPKRRAADDAALARDYVFASCIIERYRGSALAEEAEAWAEGLVERGSIPAHSYSDLADLVRQQKTQAQMSKNGAVMHLRDCVHLYNDPATMVRINRVLRDARK